MGFWKKESKTSFVRDEAGKVIDVQRSGDQPRSRGTPVSDALMKQYYEKHPEKRPGTKTKKALIGFGRYLDNYSKNYAKNHRSTSSRSGSRGSGGGGLPPLASYSFQGNANPFGSMFDTGVSRPKPNKSSKRLSKNYVIVDGIAYPKAKTTKKKKKSTKKKRSSGGYGSGYDIFDNSNI